MSPERAGVEAIVQCRNLSAALIGNKEDVAPVSQSVADHPGPTNREGYWLGGLGHRGNFWLQLARHCHDWKHEGEMHTEMPADRVLFETTRSTDGRLPGRSDMPRWQASLHQDFDLVVVRLTVYEVGRMRRPQPTVVYNSS